MSNAPTGLRVSGRPSAFLGLTALVIGAIVAAAMLTAYLLHTTAIATIRPLKPVLPAPYRVLFLDRAGITVAGPASRRGTVPLPAVLGGSIRSVIPAPDGSHLLVVTGSSSTQEAWLWNSSSEMPHRLTVPGLNAKVSIHYLATVWVDPSTAHLLVAQNQAVWSTRLTIAGPNSTMFKTVQVHVSPDQLVSLSPNGHQVALSELRQGTDGFAPQEQVRLQHLFSTRSSVAYHYIGATPPTAVLWSSDNGTVAIMQPGNGLALQKSSGRSVLSAPDGRLPAVFSGGNADFAYTAGTDQNWRIHVVSLHNEVNRIVGPPISSAPQTMYWTPDDRVLVYIAADGIWQLDPSTGIVSRIGNRPAGVAVGISTALPQFSW